MAQLLRSSIRRCVPVLSGAVRTAPRVAARQAPKAFSTCVLPSARTNGSNIFHAHRTPALAQSILDCPLSRMRMFSTNTINVPEMGDSISEGTIESWEIAEGQFAHADDVVCNLETDKINAEVRAPEDGTVTKHHGAEGDTVQVGAPLFDFTPGSGGGSSEAKKEEAPKEEPKKEEAAKQEKKKAAPKKEEPKKESASKPASASKPQQQQQQSTLSASGIRERRVPMSRMRMRIAERLKDSQNTAAMLTTFQEVDMHEIMALRSRYKDDFAAKHDVKLGFMSAFVRASAHALEEIPAINASIDGSDIVYHDDVDISIAVATPKGLVTPVLRDCGKMSFADIEKEIAALGKKARDGQITLEDLAGGTFTISNGGVYGSMMGTPIVNPPQSAILGMHGIVKRATVVGDQILPRPIMYLALTYDHRLIDGREAVTFLRSIKADIEDPARMLLDL